MKFKRETYMYIIIFLGMILSIMGSVSLMSFDFAKKDLNFSGT